AGNLEPVHSSPSSNHKAAFQPIQDGIFTTLTSFPRVPHSRPLSALPTTNQVVPSPPRTATPSGTTNNYDMGWRLALRAICPATALNLTFLSIPLAPIAQSNRIALEHLQP
ncbi:hypothetical protein TNCV_3714741, partial [Trichonephila clavipes]